jgi:carbonic anhydrase/acetyltransferase-like protein (isoleucine patch superfamily)
MLYRFDNKQPQIGEDSYVSELALVVGDVVIGRRCYVGHGAVLRGDYGRIVVGDGTALEEGAVVHAPPHGTNHIGADVTIGHGAVVHGRCVGDGAVVGMNATLSLGSEVGEGAIVAEGSVVKRGQTVAAAVVVAGNPAAFIRDVREKDVEFWSAGKRLYVDLAAKYLREGMERVD